MKHCMICDIEYPLSEYYKHPKMGDGYVNKCKSCCKKQAKERHDLLIQDPNFVESEKARARDKYYRLYTGIKADPEIKKKAMANYKAKYPEKVKAKNYTSNMKPTAKGNQFHHWSYNQEHYKDVIEMDVTEHRKLHRYMIYDQERMMYRTLNGVLLDTKEAHMAYYETLHDKD
jgi:hypothetical protein